MQVGHGQTRSQALACKGKGRILVTKAGVAVDLAPCLLTFSAVCLMFLCAAGSASSGCSMGSRMHAWHRHGRLGR